MPKRSIPTKDQYLITIAPAVDKFVLDCAREQMVDVTAFGLPSELMKFTKESKKVSSNSDPRFKSLFAAIKDHIEIRSLKMTLKYLCENQYHSDSEYLKEGVFSIRIIYLRGRGAFSYTYSRT